MRAANETTCTAEVQTEPGSFGMNAGKLVQPMVGSETKLTTRKVLWSCPHCPPNHLSICMSCSPSSQSAAHPPTSLPHALAMCKTSLSHHCEWLTHSPRLTLVSLLMFQRVRCCFFSWGFMPLQSILKVCMKFWRVRRILTTSQTATEPRRVTPLPAAWRRAPAAAAAREDAVPPLMWGACAWRHRDPAADVAAACRLVRALALSIAAWCMNGAILPARAGGPCR